MREIKFRVWDKELKFMVDPLRYFVKMNGSIWFDLGGGDNDLIKQTFKLELMQYTGLKDKDGKEIYEGDIVTQNLYFDVKKKEPVYFEVIFQNAGWKVRDKKGLTFRIGEHSKIAGNIHENPEILHLT